MNTKEKFVITINRELGSGGRTVGEKLAERLNVPFYDKALIKALTEKYNIDRESIEKLKGRRVAWWSDFIRAVVIGQSWSRGAECPAPEGEGDPNLITTKEVFEAESEILRNLADAGSCVIAGRSGFFVLKYHPNKLSILIQASPEFRIKRVMQRQNLSREDAEKAITRVDKMRENYVSNFANTSRYDTRNYDLVIKADGKTEDEIVDIILKYIG